MNPLIILASSVLFSTPDPYHPGEYRTTSDSWCAETYTTRPSKNPYHPGELISTPDSGRGPALISTPDPYHPGEYRTTSDSLDGPTCRTRPSKNPYHPGQLETICDDWGGRGNHTSPVSVSACEENGTATPDQPGVVWGSAEFQRLETEANERRIAAAAYCPLVERPAKPPENSFPQVYFGPPAGHWIRENQCGGKTVVLDDGSMWEVDGLDRLDAALWLNLNDIAIKQDSAGSLGFDHLLINTTTGEKAHARFVGNQ